MIELSPGLAQSAFELLRLIGRQGLTLESMIAGLKRIGGMPTTEVLSLTQSLNWIQVADSGLLKPTNAGDRVLDAGTYEAMLRHALIDHATLLSPPWLQTARMGRNRPLSFAPMGVRQVLVEAGVAEGTDQDVIAFWDQLASLARGQRDQRLTAIGRLGERLSLQHEEMRTGSTPRWVAIDSNSDGFDILSIIAVDNDQPLSIEVKTTTVGMTGEIILTRHEWETATNAAAHRFDLWDLSRPQVPRHALVEVDSVAAHMPIDQNAGRWEQVVIPFSAFSKMFTQD